MSLTAGVIHADVSEQNVIVQERPAAEQTTVERYTVGGIIDWGHSQEAYFVMDVAIAIMYMMVDSKFMDPLEVGGHLLFGYCQHRPLTDAEFDALKVLVASRFCQSLVLGAYSYSKDPGNEYLLLTAKQGWKVLEQLWRTDKAELYSRWRETMKEHSSKKL